MTFEQQWCESACTLLFAASNMVNDLKFRTLFSFCSKIGVGDQDFNSQNACQKTKQGRP